ncbi:MAG: electron transport complex subunit E [Clostridia bacterium]|nr:electron transport complex subunit E [Clostridia bacterium]
MNKLKALLAKLKPSKAAKKPQNEYISALTRGLVKENPTLRLVLGTCPTLAVTTAALNGLGMGLAATFVLVCSNVVVSLLRKFIPDKVRLPGFIVIIAAFTTIVQMLVKAYLPAIDQALGIYLPLIVVNCIILGRAEAFASKHSVGLSALDGLGMGAGFTAALVIMGAIREFLGNGTLFGWPENGLFPAVSVFVLPAGGFFVFGMMIWLVNKLVRHFEGEDAPIATSVCGGCPNASNCGHCTGEVSVDE